jgi:hypothetical protein
MMQLGLSIALTMQQSGGGETGRVMQKLESANE